MKRFLLILSLIAVIAAEDLYTQEQITVTKGFMKECKDSTGITAEKVEEMMDRVFVEDDKSTSYMLCLYHKFKFMEQDGTVNKENLRKFFGQHSLSAETLDRCINEKGENSGSTAFRITKCYMQSLPPNVRGWVK